MSSGDAIRRLSFDRADPRSVGDTFVYTANSDGTQARRLTANHTCCPGWSHDGRKLTLPAELGRDRLTTAIVGADGRGYKRLRINDPSLSVACAGGAWSPDDTKLACESWDDADPSRNGIYTRSSSGGGVVTRLTSNPGGGDLPGSYSPDGKAARLLRFDRNGNSFGLFLVNADGRGLRRLTPVGVIMQGGNSGDWSPSGDKIIFSRKASPAARGAIWVIRADGSNLHQIDVKSLACGSSFGCHGPRWSPDGKRIIFAGNSARGSNIFTIDANGSGLVQITHDGSSDDPNW